MPVSLPGGERPNERSDSVIDDDADFVKLFVGQIPKDMNEDILLPFFAEFGPVAELTVIRDKVNQSHKGLFPFHPILCSQSFIISMCYAYSIALSQQHRLRFFDILHAAVSTTSCRSTARQDPSA